MDTALSDRVLRYLQEHLTPARFHHTIGTCKVARRLAERYGVPSVKANLAALLHDTARKMESEELVRYVREHGLKVPYLEDIVRHNPLLLHGLVGAEIARTEFGVRDREILNAVERHTIASPGMSTLDKIIYLSDLTSAERAFRGARKLREQSLKDLDRALMTAMALKIRYVTGERKWIHPNVIKAWNELIERVEP